jgi:N-acetylmuramoyl-L-alanine amidase
MIPLRCLAIVVFVAACASADAEECRVALDVGHTPGRPGALSARGVPEYRFNRSMVAQLVSLLRAAGVEPVTINSAQREIPLAARSREAAAAGADLLLSIHHDSAQPGLLTPWEVDGRALSYTDSIAGYSLFVSGKQRSLSRSIRLAKAIGAALRADDFVPSPHHAEPIPGEHRPWVDPDLGIYRFDDLVVLKTAAMPAVLIECGVIVNRAEELTLADAGNRRRLAGAIADAVRGFCVDLATGGMRAR